MTKTLVSPAKVIENLREYVGQIRITVQGRLMNGTVFMGELQGITNTTITVDDDGDTFTLGVETIAEFDHSDIPDYLT